MLRIKTNLREFVVDENNIRITNRNGVGISIFNLAKKKKKEGEYIEYIEPIKD